MTDSCFHCGLPVPHGTDYHLIINNESRALCCAGCEAAALLITNAGLDDYYRLRDTDNRTGESVLPDLSQWDSEAVSNYCFPRGEMAFELTIGIQGMRCAACGWLIEHLLKKQPGVVDVQVNAFTARAMLTWNHKIAKLSDILTPLAKLGYSPNMPQQTDGTEIAREKRTALKRLAVAGLGMMQSMMFAEALYFGEGSMDLATRDFFRWIGLLVAVPVIFYSGRPFLQGALREWHARRLGMDFLVSATVLLAFVASFVQTLLQGPAVFFDSAVMFVFLLLLVRHVERMIALKATAHTAMLAGQKSLQTWIITTKGMQSVSVHQLKLGDVVRVHPGEMVPTDGFLSKGIAMVDESMLTGESHPVVKQKGDPLLSGSICAGTSFDLQVTATGADTKLSHILRLAERAQAQKPRIARIADRIASRFIIALLIAVIATGAFWLVHDATRTLPVVLSMLAATCPCALSLAVPSALAAAHAALSRSGVLVLNADALPTLAKADYLVLDKTGTLTEGRARLVEIEVLPANNENRVLAIAAALLRGSAHPLAAAFSRYADPALTAEKTSLVPGQGVQGLVEGVICRLGHATFSNDPSRREGFITLNVGGDVAARFKTHDLAKPNAREILQRLSADGLQLAILSGDNETAVDEVAADLNIKQRLARQSPEDKLRFLESLQAQRRIVAMVGDGINDTMVLAGANIALVMDSGAPSAHAQADIILLDGKLNGILSARRMARRTQNIIKQNLLWSILYNGIALPFAAIGAMPPWLAAIGMSASSLLVTLNALRLHSKRINSMERKLAVHLGPSSDSTELSTRAQI